jgi:cytochrome c oxidase subunit 4
MGAPTAMSEPTRPPTYFAIFAALLCLTGATVLVAYLPLGEWHTVLALAIAVAKATLVLLFFMHLLHSTRLTWLCIAAGVFWLGIMLTLTFSDYLTRHWLSY